jgi:hypothetical protein
MRINEPVRVKGGGFIARALPLWQWRRTQGIATLVADLIQLRKTLILCHACEHKMPRHWESRYNYAFVKGFHAEGSACDYCRTQTTVNMYCAVDGAYHQEMEQARRSVAETQARERLAYMRNKKYFLGV